MGRVRDIASEMLGPIARVATLGRVRVLMYHRFSRGEDERKLSADGFRRHLEYITRHFTPISLTGILDAADGTRVMPPRPVVITVDDSYADFADVAYPLLCRHRVPACVFVVSAFMEGRDWAWYDKIRYILRESPATILKLEAEGAQYVLPLGNSAEREAAWQRLATDALALTVPSRARLVADLASAAEVVVPSSVPDEFRACSAEELRAMDPDLVQVGGHTETHPILSGCSDEELEREVVASRARLQTILGLPIDTFCYPNGGVSDYDDRAIQAVRRAGYRGATVVGGGPCSLDAIRSDPFRIPRHSIGPSRRETVNGLNGVTYLRDALTVFTLRRYASR